jgi:hypothetical protein
MRESSLQTLADRRHALLDQASAALRGRVVALWRMVREDQAVTEIVSASENTLATIEFDLAGWLQRWGRVAPLESLWVGCRMDTDHWHVAPVRSDPPRRPPAGVERRSPERLVIDLAGLCFGALEPLWSAADQATVYLCAALEVLQSCLGRVHATDGLSPHARARLLADLAGVADAIDGALGV